MPKVFEPGVSKRICVPAEELSKAKSFFCEGLTYHTQCKVIILKVRYGLRILQR